MHGPMNVKYSGNVLPTFRDKISAPSLRAAKRPRPLKMRPIRFPETSVRNHHYSLRNNPEERDSQA